MATQLSYYDILGAVPGAPAADVECCYQAKAAILAPSMLAGAPSKVVTMADRARAALELARRTLTDPVLRERYDIRTGNLTPGGGLARPVSPPSDDRRHRVPGWNAAGGADADSESAVAALGVIADWLAPRPARPRYFAVPDARGLFTGPARLLFTANDLRVEVTRLTRDPLPVEGLVVDQSPRPDTNARRDSTITLQVWHPSRQRSRTG